MSKSNQASDPNSRRSQLRAEQEKAAKEAKVRRIITFGGLGVVAVAIVGLVVWGVVAATNAAKVSAEGVKSVYAATIGQSNAPVTLDVYQDFMCPVCGQFESVNGDDISSLLSAGTIKVRIHPMNFLDDGSKGTKYSTRAANAFVTVWKAEPDKAFAFNKALYANQPQENTTGLTDDQIASIARTAGVSDSVIATFTENQNVDFVNNSNAEAYSSGVKSTPTVLINGTAFAGNLFTAGELKAAIEKAAGAN